MPPEADLDLKDGVRPAAEPAVESAVQAPEAAPAGQEPDTNTGDSGGPKTLLDAALKALAPADDAETTAAAEPAGDDGAKPDDTQAPETDTASGDAQDDVPRLSDAVFKALPQEARRAFNQLRTQIKTLRPDATRGAALSRYMQESGISPEEFVALQDAGALLKRDPAAARKILAEKLAEIDRVLGNTLPDDLQQEVEGGYITEERARELAQARARAARAEDTVVADRRQAIQQVIERDVTAWETEMRRVDPDFERKLPDIRDRIDLALRKRVAEKNYLRSGAEAVQIAQDALKAVNALVASFTAPKADTRRVPSSAASAPATRAQPRTIYEAAEQGLARTG